jgi:type II secretory pathway component HofQ
VKKQIVLWILTCIVVSTACAEGKVFTNKDLERYQSRALQSGLNVKSTKISIDFVDANLYQVLQMIAEVAKKKDGVTIFVSPEISGTVTIKVSNVPWTEVLKDLIQKHHLTALSLGKKTLLIYARG